ncbi:MULTISPECIES: lipocalin family protein [Galbibacter]|uniref:Lipocalin family protein n=1 Tax=Galbibacter pacificus TaxID=2996052 RepID=A0ABT6FRA9_9FLAO|nr:lipocalin family protein [Galbibacter pacificus]MDG3581890.1 lipocalin family protein [Galbibacter pacificus]MDG3585636.1 lipocalin family protein [Galbibacter pacificus]
MKSKVYIVMLFSSIIMASCGLSKENRDSRKSLDGTWQLTHIDYQNNQGYFKSVLFNDVSSKCFEGSEWFFRSNNSTGYYNIQKPGECAPGQRNIRWSIQDDASGNPSKFQFKFIDEKKNDIGGGYGYVFNINSLSAQQMVISTNANVEGEMVTVVYTYNKISSL